MKTRLYAAPAVEGLYIKVDWRTSITSLSRYVLAARDGRISHCAKILRKITFLVEIGKTHYHDYVNIRLFWCTWAYIHVQSGFDVYVLETLLPVCVVLNWCICRKRPIEC